MHPWRAPVSPIVFSSNFIASNNIRYNLLYRFGQFLWYSFILLRAHNYCSHSKASYPSCLVHNSAGELPAENRTIKNIQNPLTNCQLKLFYQWHRIRRYSSCPYPLCIVSQSIRIKTISLLDYFRFKPLSINGTTNGSYGTKAMANAG